MKEPEIFHEGSNHEAPYDNEEEIMEAKLPMTFQEAGRRNEERGKKKMQMKRYFLERVQNLS